MRVWIAAATSLAVAAAVGGGWLMSRTDTQARHPSSSTPAQRVTSLADTTYASFAGTERQQDAGFVLGAYALNHSMDVCMNAAGYPDWDWSTSRQYAIPTDPLATGIWFSEPNRAFRSELLIAERSRLIADDAMNADNVDPKQQAAVANCASTISRVSDAKAQDATVPRAAAALIQQWQDTIRVAAESSAETPTYYGCMDASAIPVLTSTGLPATELDQAISTLDPPTDDIPTSPSDPASQSEAWQNLLTEQKTITDADWACRKDVYDAHIADLEPVIAHFAAVHRDDIADAQKQWADIADRAAELGYHGQTGPLG